MTSTRTTAGGGRNSARQRDGKHARTGVDAGRHPGDSGTSSDRSSGGDSSSGRGLDDSRVTTSLQQAPQQRDGSAGVAFRRQQHGLRNNPPPPSDGATAVDNDGYIDDDYDDLHDDFDANADADAGAVVADEDTDTAAHRVRGALLELPASGTPPVIAAYGISGVKRDSSAIRSGENAAPRHRRVLLDDDEDDD